MASEYFERRWQQEFFEGMRDLLGGVSRRVCSALIADDLQPFEQRLAEAEGRWLKERAGHNLSLTKFGCFVLLSTRMCSHEECANGSAGM